MHLAYEFEPRLEIRLHNFTLLSGPHLDLSDTITDTAAVVILSIALVADVANNLNSFMGHFTLERSICLEAASTVRSDRVPYPISKYIMADSALILHTFSHISSSPSMSCNECAVEPGQHPAVYMTRMVKYSC